MRSPVDFTTNNNGYEFLDYVGNNTLHSGRDYNYGSGSDDYGLPIYSISDAEVVYVLKDSWRHRWGNMVILYIPKYGVWTRAAHLKDYNVKVGDKIKEGTVYGHIGGTGKWISHLHFDIIIKKISSWSSYTKNWNKYKVQEYYADPETWISDMMNEEIEHNVINEPEIVVWAKKWGIKSKWELPYKEEDIYRMYEHYHLLYLSSTVINRKKMCTIESENKKMATIVNSNK